MSPKLSDEHKELRRQQILEAAERVFMRRGYELATMKDFVEEAEMSRGWIYLYFSSKEDIFEALLERFDAEQARDMNEFAEETDSAWEALLLYLNQHRRDLSDAKEGLMPTLYEYFLSGWRDEHNRARVAQRFEGRILDLARLLQRGVDTKQFKPTAPVRTIAAMIVAQLDGLWMQALAAESGAVEADTGRQFALWTDYIKQLLGVRKKALARQINRA